MPQHKGAGAEHGTTFAIAGGKRCSFKSMVATSDFDPFPLNSTRNDRTVCLIFEGCRRGVNFD